jgi:hypothetical protein
MKTPKIKRFENTQKSSFWGLGLNGSLPAPDGKTREQKCVPRRECPDRVVLVSG